MSQGNTKAGGRSITLNYVTKKTYQTYSYATECTEVIDEWFLELLNFFGGESLSYSGDSYELKQQTTSSHIHLVNWSRSLMEPKWKIYRQNNVCENPEPPQITDLLRFQYGTTNTSYLARTLSTLCLFFTVFVKCLRFTGQTKSLH